ncbi:PLD nuclease N-terminal domain-containing protein [Salinimicrobium soli]|uniref:PLD nuclease N-terminal domain-containing protein n=1 Tax=Salinimicrobium soli TaxID=1254399 RepID=UPI003AB03977
MYRIYLPFLFSFQDLTGLFFILILALIFGSWVFCLIDILTSRFRGSEKLLWFLLVLFAPLIGMILYLLLGKKRRPRRRRFNPYQKRHF